MGMVLPIHTYRMPPCVPYAAYPHVHRVPSIHTCSVCPLPTRVPFALACAVCPIPHVYSVPPRVPYAALHMCCLCAAGKGCTAGPDCSSKVGMKQAECARKVQEHTLKCSNRRTFIKVRYGEWLQKAHQLRQ